MNEIRVPELGESITEGTITHWAVQEGDVIHEGDVILEIETDKVNLEVSAEETGVLAEIKKQAGDTVEVGEVIALLRPAGDATGDEQMDGKREQEEPAAKQEKAPVQTTQHADTPPSPAEQMEAQQKGALLASPATRKKAREQGIDLSQFGHHDPLGRVRLEQLQQQNVEKAASQPNGTQGQTKSIVVEQEQIQLSGQELDRPFERRRMSRRRQTIAKRLVEAQQTAAMLTTFNEVDMSAIMDIRRRRKDAFREKYHVGLGYMSFFTKAVVGALKAFPLLNAEIDGDEILIKKFYDIGVAVSTEEGLIVPVVRNADRLSFAQIEQQIAHLAEKARSKSLTLAEIQGGTFTITNGGVFGSLLSTPILNTPQVGILGMHKIQTRPVTVDGDRIENRPMMYLALSYDHRIIDGREAVSFLVKIKELLEDPETLLIEGS